MVTGEIHVEEESKAGKRQQFRLPDAQRAPRSFYVSQTWAVRRGASLWIDLHIVDEGRVIAGIQALDRDGVGPGRHREVVCS